MKINDLLQKNLMIMDLQATDKQSAIEEMVQRLYEEKIISNIEEFKAEILAVGQTSTGLGDGVAMPHAKRNTAVLQ